MTLVLDGLSCQNCATKIEDRALKLDGITVSQLDFLNSELNISYEGVNEKELFTELVNLINSIESGLNVYIKGSNEKNEEEGSVKKEIGIFAFGFFVYILAFVFDEVSLYLYIASYLIIGRNVIKSAVRNILNREIFDENFLMMVATLGAFYIGEYPEAVAVMIFFEIGETLQQIAVNRSRKSIKSLIAIKPEKANLFINDEIKVVKPEDLKVDDVIVVKIGEKVPVNGVVIDGNSQLDTSSITGESVPLMARENTEVLGGFINLKGIIRVRVTSTYENSAISRIIKLIEEGNKNKAETEKFITKFAKVYTPVVVGIAAILAFIFPIFLGDFNYWIYTACVFLVVSCPCALVVSVPLTFFTGIGRASKEGILFKGSNYLELLAKTENVAFDKTGTLTKGTFKVTKENFNNKDDVKYLTSLEVLSNHPISTTIVNNYENDYFEVEDFEEVAGKGIIGKINNQQVLAGNYKLMSDYNIAVEDTKDEIGTIIYLAKENEYLGYILLSDEIKENSLETIKLLNKRHIGTFLLTGDNKNIGDRVGQKLGVSKVYSSLLPEDKVSIVEEIKTSGNTAFIGDGINDAPVLTISDIGISMGTGGSDLAIDVSDVVFVNDDPINIIKAIAISKITMIRARENIIFSVGIKILFMVLALFGLTNIWMAVFADVGVTLLAILNSIRKMRI